MENVPKFEENAPSDLPVYAMMTKRDRGEILFRQLC